MSTARTEFGAGFRAMLPPMPGVIAWGLVTGVAMSKSGLSLVEALGMTLLAYAGSAQLASLPLIAAVAPVWVIFLTSVVVNLRFVLYGAALRREFTHESFARRTLVGYLIGDVTFVLFLRRLRETPALEHRTAHWLGLALCNWLGWQVGSIVGILAATRIPAEWGLDLAGMLALLALLVPAVRNVPAGAGALVAVAVSLVTLDWPLRLGLLAAVVAGIGVALIVDAIEPSRESESA
jgi:predicted branched-subunit amino acid permease